MPHISRLTSCMVTKDVQYRLHKASYVLCNGLCLELIYSETSLKQNGIIEASVIEVVMYLCIACVR